MEIIEKGDDELLDTPRTAQILDVKPSTLEVWRNTKRYELPYVRVGRNIRYRRPDVLAFIEKRTEKGTAI